MTGGPKSEEDDDARPIGYEGRLSMFMGMSLRVVLVTTLLTSMLSDLLIPTDSCYNSSALQG